MMRVFKTSGVRDYCLELMAVSSLRILLAIGVCYTFASASMAEELLCVQEPGGIPAMC